MVLLVTANAQPRLEARFPVTVENQQKHAAVRSE
jgi:hypothetical protein